MNQQPYYRYGWCCPAAIGFILGEVCGDNARHRKCLQQTNAELREELQEVREANEPLHRAIHKQRGVIHDIHKHVVAVTKALQNRPS